ncbi:UDP-2,4-diacetamido-2,4,6-trideoxy-beta-L-altropyranose hydrolase [Salmonirosea aquatica]|uniref:UDP-2,4-diacetamido-2,4, 6-trideoxy-beta-L-altropyranose hydrolase n=1 Tax=Salmonirosea aquatica TaxID=2654236 RepID=A0A7C9BT77_9BACT|nr:UDP-2,4-diacetamido-2,4,6-trideoxy-beta-L-altropyranose hydrolase [Cytophagaceae bacterium SJW1-29]
MVYFRADGNSNIGLGHITRSLALADILAEYFSCVFLVQDPAPELAAQIQESHFLVRLPQTDAYLAEAQQLANRYLSQGKLVVLDGYEFRTEYQEIIKSTGAGLVCIDDLHAWHFLADAVINHAGDTHSEEYSAEPNTRLYLGPKYAILRQPFLRAARQARFLPEPRHIFICFGGADSFNLTTQATRAAQLFTWVETIHIVTGSAYAHGNQLASLANLDNRLRLHHNLNAQEMADLMESCEIAIGPASGIAYEICSVGMWLITGYYVDNQKHLYRYLTKNSLGLAAGNFPTGRIEELLSIIKESVTKPIFRQKEHFDGKSAARLLGIFISLAMRMDLAGKEDMPLYYTWANDPETRRNSIQSDIISWEDHQKWFKTRIDNPAFVFYIFRMGSTAVGQVRFKITYADATISYSLDHRFRGMGLGYEILSQSIRALSWLHPQKKIIGVVKNDNFASLTVFQKLGFTMRKAGSVTYFEKS